MNKMISILLFILFLFAPWFKGGRETAPLAVIQVIILFAGLLCLLRNRYFPFSRSSRLNFPLVVFIGFCFLSTIYSMYLNNSILGFISVIIFIILYQVLVYNSTDSINDNLFMLIFITVFVISIVSFEKNLFPNRNLLAGYLVIGIVIGLTRIMINMKDWLYDGKYGHVVLFSLPILVMFISLVKTHSRAGYLGLAAAVIFFAITRYRKWGIAAVSAVLILTFVIVPSSGIRKVLKMDSADPYSNQRPNIWKGSARMILERPFLGTGPGNFEYGFLKYNFPVYGALAQYGKHPRFAHNEYLHLGAETGLIPLFMFLWIVWLFFAHGIKRLYITGDNKKLLWHYFSSMAGVVAILTHALVDFNLHLPAISMAFVFFLSVVMRKEDSKQLRCVPRAGIVFPLAFSVMLFIVICNFTAHYFSGKKNHAGAAKAVRFAPLNAESYRLLGDEALTREEKLSAYKKMVSLHPREPYYRQTMGDFYYNGEPRDLINALREFRLAVKYDSRNPSALFKLASCYFNQGEFNKALKGYTRTVLVEPYYVRALYQMGECYWSLDDKEKAKQQYDKILRLKHIIPRLRRMNSKYDDILVDFDYALVYNSFGKYWMSRKNPDQAIVYYKRALDINPDYAEVYNNIAGIYFARKSYLLAEMHISKAIELDPSNRIYAKNMKMITETRIKVEK